MRKTFLPLLLFFTLSIFLHAQEDDETNNTDVQVSEPETNSTSTTEKKLWYKNLRFSLGAGLLILFEDYKTQGDTVGEAAPMPVLPFPAFNLGAFEKGKMFRIMAETSLDVYWTHYKWSDPLGCPLPEETENRSAMVWGIVWGIKAQGSFNYNYLKVRLSGGICFDFRIITVAMDLNDSDFEDNYVNGTNRNANYQVEKIKEYFYSAANWLYGEIGLGLDYLITEKYAIGLDFKIYIPFTVPPIAKETFFGGGRLGIGVRITFY